MRIDIPGYSRDNGVRALTYGANGGWNQKFVIIPQGAGVYAFKSISSGKYLTASGSSVVQNSKGSALANTQLWLAERAIGGAYLRNVATGTYITMTAGNGLALQAYSGSAYQVVKPFGSNLLSNGYYILQASNGLYADVMGNSGANGARVITWSYQDTNNQKWYAEAAGNGYYIFKSAHAGLAMDIAGASNVSGTPIQQFTPNYSAAQLWQLVPADDGNVYFKSAMGDIYLTLSSGNLVIMATSNPGTAQKFMPYATIYTPYNGTFADVNLSTQTMFYVKNGYKVLESPIVTGAPWMGTPTGTYYITRKESPSVLVGADYRSPVSFWMPFVGNSIGFHDANWQPWFGGNRYLTNGSHGCVNMPYAQAAQLYSLISVGDKVIVHW
jgi:hypothetical protein